MTSHHIQPVQFTASQYSAQYNDTEAPYDIATVVPNMAVGHVTVFECPVCQRRFASKKYLSMHAALHKMSSVGGAGNADDDVVVVGRPSPFRPSTSTTVGGRHGSGSAQSWSCPVCGKTFAQNSNFRNHVRTHSDERPYVCLVCFIGFKERYHLKKHALFKHSGELKEQCRQCGKRFKDLTAVRAHERTHSDLRPYQCDRCSKTFKTSECLWHHENRSKTCGRSPSEIASGGRRRHLATTAANNQLMRDRVRLNADDCSLAVAGERPVCSTASSLSSSSPIKNETTMGNFDSNQVDDLDLDLELDGGLGQFNAYTGTGLHWSAIASHPMNGRLGDDQLPSFRHHSQAETTSLMATDCLIASDQAAFAVDCATVEFQLNCDETMASLDKQTALHGIGDYDVDEYDVKSYYDVIEGNTANSDDSSGIVHDFRFVVAAGSGGSCSVSHDSLLGATGKLPTSPACSRGEYRDDAPEMNSSPANSFNERHNGNPMTLSWCPSSVPTAIVAPMQRNDNPHQQQQQQQQHQHHRQQLHPPHHNRQHQQQAPPEAPTFGASKCLLPPFETFVPPRRPRGLPAVAAQCCSRAPRCRPQQQFPTVARYLLQATQSYAPRQQEHCRMSGVQVERVNSHSIQYDGHITAVDGLSSAL